MASFSPLQECGPSPCLYPLFFFPSKDTLCVLFSQVFPCFVCCLRLSYLLFVYLLPWVIPIISCSFVRLCVQLCPYLRPYRTLLFVLVCFNSTGIPHFAEDCLVSLKCFFPPYHFRHGSHLRQNLDKFVLITIKSVKFLSSVDHAKCDLLVWTQTKTCLRRQIFKSAVVLPRSTTFCEQRTKIVFLAVNLSVNSVNLKIFSASHFTFCCYFSIVHG